ncbi:hypothetical protein FOA52_015439 [Chlamydomonas sp. UWO 241]|nr:hypothetical protein FOA52_015439 [Chlamydomonas sp. UWO 241]
MLLAHRTVTPLVGPSSAGAVFEPQRGLGIQTDATLNATYLDTAAAIAGQPTQRFNVTIGALIAAGSVSPTTWKLSLANINDQIPSGAYSYTIRTTCMRGPALPCARPKVTSNECNGQGTCTRPSGSPSVNYCTCSSSSYAGDSCGVEVTNIAALGITTPQGDEMRSSVNTDVPPAAWRYFYVTVPPSDFSTLRTELVRPPNSAGAYHAAIQVTADRLPTRAEFSPRSLTTGGYSQDVWAIDEACTCISCSCYMLYQAETLTYDLRVSGQTAGASKYFIGIYNNLATSTPIAQLLNLSVTWTSNGRDLCPGDCSGHGECTNYATGDGVFACTCRPGYGGAYCQGGMETVSLGSGDARAYTNGPTDLSPGQWAFHTFSSEESGTLTMQFSEEDPTSPIFLIFAPLYATSFGEQYFQPTTSWVFNKSMGVQIPGSSGKDGDIVAYIIGVLNSQTQSAVTSTYQITIALPSKRGLSFLSTLQMALIGAVSGLIVALLVFMGFRLVLMRRQLSRLTPEEMAMFNGMGVAGPHGVVQLRPIFPGVPANIVAAFRCFEYNPETFAEQSKKKVGGSGDDGVVLEKDSAVIGVYHWAGREGAGESDSLDGEEGADGIAAAGAGAAAAAGAAAGAAGSAAGGDKNDAPQCSVCICDYEDGELLMQLPCGHVFHQPCITTWMRAHNTCPNCRMSLVPPPTEEEIGEMRAEAERRQRAVDGVLWGWGRGGRVHPSVGGGAPSGPPPAGMQYDPSMPPPPGYPPPPDAFTGDGGQVFSTDGQFVGDGNGPHHPRHPGPDEDDLFSPAPVSPAPTGAYLDGGGEPHGGEPHGAQGYRSGGSGGGGVADPHAGAGYGAGGRPEVEMVEAPGGSSAAPWRSVRAPVELAPDAPPGQVPGQVIDSRAGSASGPPRASLQPPAGSQV